MQRTLYKNKTNYFLLTREKFRIAPNRKDANKRIIKSQQERKVLNYIATATQRMRAIPDLFITIGTTNMERMSIFRKVQPLQTVPAKSQIILSPRLLEAEAKSNSVCNTPWLLITEDSEMFRLEKEASRTVIFASLKANYVLT